MLIFDKKMSFGKLSFGYGLKYFRWKLHNYVEGEENK